MLKTKYKNDILLVLCILIFALAILLVFFANRKDGKIVKVSIDGKPVVSYNISDNIETNIAANGDTNVLVIKNGNAYISQADCPDKICVSHRKISKTGETIVCLPHKLVVEITIGE